VEVFFAKSHLHLLIQECLAQNQHPFHVQVIELKDGSLVMVGRTNNPVTGNDDIIVTKTTNAGVIIWNKTYKSRLWTSGNSSTAYFSVQEIKQDPYSGDLFICGNFWRQGRAVMRLSQSSGSLIWSNTYQYSNGVTMVPDRAFGLDFTPTEIRYFGRFLVNNTYLSIHRLDRNTGDTLQTKVLRIGAPATSKMEFLTGEPVTVLANGNYAISGGCYDGYPTGLPTTVPLHQAAVVELDQNFNFVRAFSFRNLYTSNTYNPRVSIFPDGSGMFTMRWLNNGNAGEVCYVQSKGGLITKQRKQQYIGESVPGMNRVARPVDGSDVMVDLSWDGVADNAKLHFLKLHTTDTSSTCLGIDDTATFVQWFTYVPALYPLDSIGRNVFQENLPKTIMAQEVSFGFQPGCEQVAHCDSLQLVAPVTSVCLGQSLQVTIRKNEGCGALAPLVYNTSAVNSVIRLNDSTLSLQFNTVWSGYIYASIQGCKELKDSLFIQVLQSPTVLNLGPDKSLCPGNTILLNALSGYASYLWQDGSTDSTFTVTQPGLYHVSVSNACGGVYKDSVHFTAAPPIPFDIGPDRTKCNHDTIQITAPSGFLNFSWSNSYNISSTTAQTVVVNPLVDTSYHVRAEKTPGCFAYDTVRITVSQSPPINLGLDKSFCLGDSAVFTAGSGFQSYSWSNGQTSPQIVVKSAGQYSVIGTTVEGCKSFDTVKVTSVYPLPIVSLDQATAICLGTSKTLAAGNFSSYQWNTGATTPTLSVNSIGVYAVTVIDANSCIGSDTTAITTLYPLPAGFLPIDTSICSYGSLQLKPTTFYKTYLWSTGAVSPSVSITQPGFYWLEVRDNNTCKGKDSIVVSPKDCLKGFYAPTAFTPNGDNRNDVFRPLLFGNVKKYQFTVYNRWGQIVFQTKELQKGWDGKVGGVPQQSNAFVWTCSYQFEGETQRTEKGSVMVIR
jgi:gliding motility-associated-like protein